MTLKKEQSLRQAIAREEANLAALEQEQQKNRGRLAVLKPEVRGEDLVREMALREPVW